MIEIRRSDARGHADFGWLDSRHTFSFGQYHDPRYQGFSDLLVINEDRVAPGAGFPTHGHQNMEILSYVLAGELAHADTIGTRSVIRPGEVQRMTAGTGIRHSEFNHSSTESVHFLQIWIQPGQAGLHPGYEQKHFDAAQKRNRFCLVASPDGRDGSLTVHQDALLYAVCLDAGQELARPLDPARRAWLQVARGEVELNGIALGQGDGAALAAESRLSLAATEDAELLLFDLA